MSKTDSLWITFPTAPGICGMTWSADGITSFHLPEVSGKDIEKRLIKITGKKKAAAAVPKWIRELIRKIKAHLEGTAQDFSDVPVSFDEASDFTLSVYKAIRGIQAGKVLTYSELASLIGKPAASRAVGNALGMNPIPLIVPCHRVITSSRKLGGYSAPGGVETKAALLAGEGIYLTKPVTIGAPAQWEKAVNELQKRDKVFARLVKKVGPLHFKPRLDKEPLSALITAIVMQQLSGKAAAGILDRVNALVSENGLPSAGKILNTSDADLRKTGISNMKVSFLKDLSRKYLDGGLPKLEELKLMPDEQIIKTFTRIKGVGRWTVEMYLIFNLGRADVFPTLDFGVRKAISQVYGLPGVAEAKDVEKYGERWKPYRTVASLYLWHSLDNKP